MGKWRWEGIDKSGKKLKGEIEATNERDVRKQLRQDGVRPRKIIPPSILEFDLSEWMVEKGLAKSFGTPELLNFTKQLYIMIDAGIPILQAMEIIYKSEKNPSLKKAVKNIARDVGEGKTIADSMTKQKGFSKLYCNLVRAGEAGGILDTILQKLMEHMEKQEKTKAAIKSALTYPVIVVAVGVGVIWGMMVFVVPKFQEMLRDSGQETPFITQLVVDTSNAIQQYTPYAVPILFVALVILNAWRKSPQGKPIYDLITMKMPIFGGIIVKGNLSSFSRTLATMLGAGVSLVDALDICIETIDNAVIARDIKVVRKAVVEGKTLTEPLMKIEYFPELVAQMVKVGEQTGSIDSMLLKVAEVFDDQVNELMNNMTKMIEPLIIVVLGSIVAVILVAMYLPIFMSAGGAD